MDVRRCAGEEGDDGDVKGKSCPLCKLDWPYPRTVRWPKVATPPPGLFDIPPSTTDTLVAYQTFDKEGVATIPEDVYKTFNFAVEGTTDHVGNRHLVEGLRFTKTQGLGGKSVSSIEVDLGSTKTTDTMVRSGTLKRQETSLSVFLAEGESERDHAYVRLMTLNNWYWKLFNALLLTIFIVADLQGNFMLTAALLSDAELIAAIGKGGWVFTFAWCAMLGICLYAAYREACLEWNMKTHPAKGDLISNCSLYSRLTTFISMVALEFFLVEKDVKDVVINLHPWKGVQDYSAFKSEGHRAYFIGYRSKTMHRVENIRTVWHCLPVQLFTKLSVFAFKVYLCYMLFIFEDRRQISYSLISSASISLGAILSDAIYLRDVYKIRRIFKTRLLQRLSLSSERSPQYKADIRLLMLHFRRVWDSDTHRARRPRKNEMEDGAWIGKCDGCRACGRKSDDIEQPLGSVSSVQTASSEGMSSMPNTQSDARTQDLRFLDSGLPLPSSVQNIGVDKDHIENTEANASGCHVFKADSRADAIDCDLEGGRLRENHTLKAPIGSGSQQDEDLSNLSVVSADPVQQSRKEEPSLTVVSADSANAVCGPSMTMTPRLDTRRDNAVMQRDLEGQQVAVGRSAETIT